MDVLTFITDELNTLLTIELLILFMNAWKLYNFFISMTKHELL